ncbi:hypothetical protein HNP46_000321 [Pseudomonas nitritireducens]|uniref:Uncharacterized protein n=1 Tax=Pseudomonas nitroreducens TaxID=46680 RepID=A0A7W7KFE5_PSENT|nr:hypothetical protein [Pseudomonas nitritireducens]MBB4861510.1 hypothetical protein [Pseudomonas nitritireducens]
MANRQPMSIVERYGCTLRIYDNGGASYDRYTMVPPRWAKEYRDRNGDFESITSNEHPFHPTGFGQHCTAEPGPHLGKRIHWDMLPPDAQRFARQDYPEFCPPSH